MPKIIAALFERQLVRFALNGLAATAVHYAALTFFLEVVHVPSAGISNGIASFFGISASYIGNRVFVFGSKARVSRTLPAFVAIYAIVAAVHAGFLWIWTDIGQLPYPAGFVIATAISTTITFLASKIFVFKP